MKRALIAVAVLGGALAAWADSDRPARGVARLSVLNGDVSIRRGDSGDLIAGAVNGPLVAYDRLLTGPASKAEAQFDYANMIRLWSMTEVRFVELEYGRYTVQVANGTITFRVLRDSQAEVEVNTPNLSVRPVKRGTYRITVREDGTSEVTVRSGEADIFTPRGSERLMAGRTMIARGSAADPEFQTVAAIRRDEWDEWNERRDRDLERSRSYQYVSRDIYGAEDLDTYGRWVYVDPYGWVWSPVVAVGWAPYRYGRWAWVDWYGWTWISYDPWGWAPYHYGRWFYRTGFGWCWWPGGVRVRHYWSPALVAFFGWGGRGHVHAGIGFGHVGWVPLAPHEPYYPWYGPRYYGPNRVHVDNSVTIVNNVNITNVYRNARVENGITGVAAEDFLRGGGARHTRVTENEIRTAQLVRGQLPVTPGRESLRWSDREARASVLPQTPEERRFFSRRPVTETPRVSFEQQRRGIEEYVRRTAPETTRSTAPAAERSAQGPARTEAAPEGRGWRRVGESQRSEGTGRSAETAPRSEGVTRQTESAPAGGWRRFGEPQTGRTEPRAPSAMDRPAATPAPRTESAPARGNSEGGWRRFEGDRRTADRPAAAPPARTETPRYEAPRTAPRRESTAPEPRSEQPRFAPRSEAPRYTPRNEAAPRTESAPRTEAAPRWASPGSSGRVQVGGPIVRERSSGGSSESRGSGSSRGESRSSGPGGRR